MWKWEQALAKSSKITKTKKAIGEDPNCVNSEVPDPNSDIQHQFHYCLALGILDHSENNSPIALNFRYQSVKNDKIEFGAITEFLKKISTFIKNLFTLSESLQKILGRRKFRRK